MAAVEKTCTKWQTVGQRRGSKIRAGFHDKSCSTRRTKKSCRVAPQDIGGGDPSKGWTVSCGTQAWNAKRGEWRSKPGTALWKSFKSLLSAKKAAGRYLSK